MANLLKRTSAGEGSAIEIAQIAVQWYSQVRAVADTLWGTMRRDALIA
jgi:hypothetical protein